METKIYSIYQDYAIDTVAGYQVRHLKALCPHVKVEIFDKMNHGQMLIDKPNRVADLIRSITR